MFGFEQLRHDLVAWVVFYGPEGGENTETMFIGHFAIGLAAKSRAPKPSLGTYFVAAQFLDLLWPVLLLLGLERVEVHPGDTAVTPLNFVSYPYSHSLIMACAYALLFAGGYALIRSDKRTALYLGAVVLSHWILDLVTHRPDLPLAPWASPLVGLGMWGSLPVTFLVETAMFVAGAWLYFRSTKAVDRTGMVVPIILLVLLFVTYVMNLFSPAPPPSPEAIAWISFGIWLFIALAYWGDRHRTQAL